MAVAWDELAALGIASVAAMLGLRSLRRGGPVVTPATSADFDFKRIEVREWGTWDTLDLICNSISECDDVDGYVADLNPGTEYQMYAVFEHTGGDEASGGATFYLDGSLHYADACQGEMVQGDTWSGRDPHPDNSDSGMVVPDSGTHKWDIVAECCNC